MLEVETFMELELIGKCYNSHEIYFKIYDMIRSFEGPPLIVDSRSLTKEAFGIIMTEIRINRSHKFESEMVLKRRQNKLY